MDNRDVTVALVEDDPELRATLRTFLEHGPGTRCVGDYATAEEALAHLTRVRPQVILMDINLPQTSGIACVRRLAPRLPDALFIMLTAFDSTEVVVKALQAGAIGYLRKPTDATQVMDAITDALAGGAPITSSIARCLLQTFRQRPADPAVGGTAELSPREQEILHLLARGLQHKEIASELGIGVSTVRSHVAGIYRKLQVCSRSQAVARYLVDRGPSGGESGTPCPPKPMPGRQPLDRDKPIEE
jgi:DNA-binding NarL/FixJ family response regulator